MNRLPSCITATFCAVLFSGLASAQPVPAQDENIPYLMTFGGGGLRETSWGDDDFSQTFFFSIPPDYNDPFYIRVYDPDVGGEIDEINGAWDTRMSYEVYGGYEAWSHPDANGVVPTGNYKSGILLASKSFATADEYDQKWYTFGPFNPAEGETVERFANHRVFKIITEGQGGDDGNLYRYYLSTSPDENRAIEGANAFTYEYTFRLWNNPENVSHVYPYIDSLTTSIKVTNFDWDNDGHILMISRKRKGDEIEPSGDDNELVQVLGIMEGEKNASLDIQFIKSKNPLVGNNNVVISIENQYGEMLEFFSIPIGGVPVYEYNIGINPIKK